MIVYHPSLFLFQYYTETARALGETIPEVITGGLYQQLYDLEGWPRSCSKRLASAINKNCYTFHYKNTHSGEEFELTLESRFSSEDKVRDEQERVTRVRLKFD